MGTLDRDDEIELVPVDRDVDDVMFELDIALACDADRHAWAHGSLWGRADLLVDPDGRARHA